MDSIKVSSKNFVLPSALANAALLIAAPNLGSLNTYTRALTDLFIAYNLPIPDLRHALQYRPMSPSSNTLDIPTECQDATMVSRDSKDNLENEENTLGLINQNKLYSDKDHNDAYQIITEQNIQHCITDIFDGYQKTALSRIDETDIKIEEFELGSVKHETIDSYSDLNTATIHVHNTPVSNSGSSIFISTPDAYIANAAPDVVLATTLPGNAGSEIIDRVPEYTPCVQKLAGKSSEQPMQYHDLQHAHSLQRPLSVAPDHPTSSADQPPSSSEYKCPQVHELTIIPATANRTDPQKDCFQCYFERKEKNDSRYHCLLCPMAPGLCSVECFKSHHVRMAKIHDHFPVRWNTTSLQNILPAHPRIQPSQEAHHSDTNDPQPSQEAHHSSPDNPQKDPPGNPQQRTASSDFSQAHKSKKPCSEPRYDIKQLIYERKNEDTNPNVPKKRRNCSVAGWEHIGFMLKEGNKKKIVCCQCALLGRIYEQKKYGNTTESIVYHLKHKHPAFWNKIREQVTM